MKNITVVAIAVLVLMSTANGFAFSAKYAEPSNLSSGSVSSFAKGHMATVAYTPKLAVSYDKQHTPWFESTLKPGNLR